MAGISEGKKDAQAHMCYEKLRECFFFFFFIFLT
jgi:hypothetical protein